MKLSSKCDFPDAGRPLTYPNELLKWIFVLSDLHFPASDSYESSRESKASDTIS